MRERERLQSRDKKRADPVLGPLKKDKAAGGGERRCECLLLCLCLFCGTFSPVMDLLCHSVRRLWRPRQGNRG